LRPAGIEWKRALAAIAALMVVSLFTAAAQNSTSPAKSVDTNSVAAFGKLPKIWRSPATQHEFRVEVTNGVFRAEWINIPPAIAKRGAYIRTECRRAGTKWEGVSHINLLFGIPGAPQGKDTKMCSLTVRFEVDSVSPEKIAGHSEVLKSFDVNACRAEQTKWGEFTWIPKK